MIERCVLCGTPNQLGDPSQYGGGVDVAHEECALEEQDPDR